MSATPMETHLETVDAMLKEHGLLEKYHCKIKDHSMLRVIDIESKARLFVKEEQCEAYIAFLKADLKNFELQFEKVNDNNYFEL